MLLKTFAHKTLHTENWHETNVTNLGIAGKGNCRSCEKHESELAPNTSNVYYLLLWLVKSILGLKEYLKLEPNYYKDFENFYRTGS